MALPLRPETVVRAVDLDETVQFVGDHEIWKSKGIRRFYLIAPPRISSFFQQKLFHSKTDFYVYVASKGFSLIPIEALAIFSLKIPI